MFSAYSSLNRPSIYNAVFCHLYGLNIGSSIMSFLCSLQNYVIRTRALYYAAFCPMRHYDIC